MDVEAAVVGGLDAGLEGVEGVDEEVYGKSCECTGLRWEWGEFGKPLELRGEVVMGIECCSMESSIAAA